MRQTCTTGAASRTPVPVLEEKARWPQDMCNAKIITLYKNKGDCSDCNNCRGISLLSIVGKVFVRVVLVTLQVLAERIYHRIPVQLREQEVHSGYDLLHSTSSRGSAVKQQIPLYISFIDPTKAFDLVSRQGLFQLLKKIGCHPQLHSIIVFLHEDMQGVVSLIRKPLSLSQSGVVLNKEVSLCRHSLAFFSHFC